MYRSGLNAFMEFIYGSQRKGLKSTKEELEKFNQLSIRYMEDKRDMGDDVLKFAGHLNSRPPKSAKAIMAAVREWLLYNDIEIGSKNIRLIRKRMPKGGARTFESDLDTATLRNILMHTDLKGKAFFLILASSGMRIGELLQLTLKDVDLTKDPVLIKLRQHDTKSKHARLTYISTEARKYSMNG
ncbi:MAG: hypothetical protein C3F06_05805 [Candidatus Methanoperedenaceae archaeon]|nr:MAG: hypothetical protein C3F06_05805 [Candidatus Methanoperedenaceae archaeon]